MRIRSKMFLLASSAMIFMAAIAAVYLVSQASSAKIESERRILLALNDSVKDLIGAINILDSGQIDASEARFKAAAAATDAGFDAAGRLKYLPRINASLKDAVEIIQNLRALASDDIVSLASSFAALKADALKYFMSTRETTLRQFYTDEYSRKKYDLKEVYKRLDDFDTLSAGLTDTLLSSSDVIAEKNALIDKDLTDQRARSLVLTAGIGAALVALALFLAFRMSRSLAMPIISIERTIKSMGGGDLRERVEVSTKDELGLLGSNLNSFLDSFSLSIGEIQAVSRENEELKRKLVQALSGASSSAVEIDAGASSIKRQVEGLDSRIIGAHESLEGMTRGIAEYTERISEQDTMISSSSSSMEGRPRLHGLDRHDRARGPLRRREAGGGGRRGQGGLRGDLRESLGHRQERRGRQRYVEGDPRDRLEDQPPGDERGHRGGARRRIGEGLRGRRGRDPQIGERGLGELEEDRRYDPLGRRSDVQGGGCSRPSLGHLRGHGRPDPQRDFIRLEDRFPSRRNQGEDWAPFSLLCAPCARLPPGRPRVRPESGRPRAR